MSKSQLPHRQMVKSHVSETWSVLVRVQLGQPIFIRQVRYKLRTSKVVRTFFHLLQNNLVFSIMVRGRYVSCALLETKFYNT